MFSYIVADWREKVNKRLKKKIDKRKRDKIHKILDLVLDINGTEPRKRSRTGNKPTALLSFSGHTSGIAVSVYSNGWDHFCSSDFSEDCYLDGTGGATVEKLLFVLKKKAVELNV